MSSSDVSDFQESILANLVELSKYVWEDKSKQPDIDRWLSNFTGACVDVDTERLHALHLLSVFTYFGDLEMRELLRALYRDIYRYPIIEKIRRENGNSTDVDLISDLFMQEEHATRFLGMGNPSESGTHLLYYFRQENELHKNLFINTHEIFEGRVMTGSPELQDPAIRRYVFIDDFCGSGTQAKQYSSKIVESIKEAAAIEGIEVTVAYYVLAATDIGIAEVRNDTAFDDVKSLVELDSTYKVFEPESRYYHQNQKFVSRDTGRAIAELYGARLWHACPLGYKDGQLLIGFHHNVPDNCLPVIWFNEKSVTWSPIFRRYPKIGA